MSLCYLSAYYDRMQEVSFIPRTIIYYPYFTAGKTGTLITHSQVRHLVRHISQELNLGILTPKHITLSALLPSAPEMQPKG